jgi:hypothetical protein
VTLRGEDRELFERSVRAAAEQHTGTALDAALTDVGWVDALAFDTPAAVQTLFEAQGSVCTSSSALSWTLAFALGLAHDATASVALPAIGPDQTPARLERGRVTVRGLLADAAPKVIVVAPTGTGHVATQVDVAALDTRVVVGIDPSFGLIELAGSTEPVDPRPADWTVAVGVGRLALAHELIGASRTMLALACDHALERIQFDQPIARFQAVRHRLAEALVAVETAAAVAEGAWEDLTPTTARLAKATAGRSARTVSRHAQQVLAGIGFTAEHDLHRYVRRVLVLDQLLGSYATLTRELGADCIADRRLPPLLPL